MICLLLTLVSSKRSLRQVLGGLAPQPVITIARVIKETISFNYHLPNHLQAS